MKSRDRRIAILLSLLLTVFGLRAHRIGEQRVWWDEGWSVWVARFSPLEILRQTGNDVHPPLYFELLHVWRALSGDSEAGLRLLSAFLGLLTVAMTYALGRRMARGTLSPPAATLAGVLAALFLTVSRFTIAWSQEIRMYALASLLAVLAVWAARRVWALGRRSDAVVFVLATAGGLYTLYLFAPVWVAINVAWLWTWRAAADRRRAFLHWVGLQLVVPALFLPWLWYASSGFLSTASATPIRLLDFLHIYWTVLTVGIPVNVAQFNHLTLPAAAVFLAAVGAVVVAVARRRPTAVSRRPTTDDGPRTTDHGRQTTDDRPQTTNHGKQYPFTPSPLPPFSPAPRQDLTLLLAILLIPAIIVYIVSLPRQNFYNPPFNPRYLVIFTPFYSILLAWGLAVLGEWMGKKKGGRGEGGKGARGRAVATTLLLAAFMVAVALVGLWPYYPGRVRVDDFPSLVSTIDAHRQPGDAVVLYTDTDWPVFAYHHPAAWIGVPYQWTITPDMAADFLAPIWESHDAVWLVTTPYSAGGDPQRHVPAWLGERATAVREFTYEDMALTLFARTEERGASADRLTQGEPPNALAVPLAGGGTLTGFAQAARDFKSGNTIHLFLYRAAGDEITTQVGLIDGRDVVFAPQTITLPATASAARQQVDLIVPPEAPSGRYRFFIIDADGRVAPFGRANITQKDATLLTADDVIIANRVDAPFAGGIRLLGYDLAAATARPGESINLRLYWTSDGNISQSYKVFTHLLGDVFNAGGGNFLWGQVDNEPAANTRPTTTWRAGEVIVDEYAIPIAPDAPSGTYRIEIGLYDPINGQRLPALGPDGAPTADHLVLITVDIE
ncbi:MAG TPA: glycosyltransferase family 39 protein [Promineifilum sp.]|nr:glycosyltransferase family 39 protein [Promineifilum sp.]